MTSRARTIEDATSFGRGLAGAVMNGACGAWKRSLVLLVLMATLLVGAAPEHRSAARAEDGSRASSVVRASSIGDRRTCPARSTYAPELENIGGYLDCPQTACAALLTPAGQVDVPRRTSHRRSEWPEARVAASSGGGRVERPPRDV